VNIASVNAQLALPDAAAYCASKGALLQLTRASALALAPYGIRVNAAGPGSISTASNTERTDPAKKQRVMARTPLRRLGTPQEIADIVAFLASDEATYITGQIIYADGGRLALNYTTD
jgi:NAD(P)-dependent dehydrogenase (short-subunit alcohol dehydrogenase family)